ncbi:MAG: DUF4349 domain-containing protein [Myxococcaceae bacterium]|nr:MAG: DUF4349 domain-containing protein [Myxococcaceae bacterium]
MTSSSLQRILVLSALAVLGCASEGRPTRVAADEGRTPVTVTGPGQHVARRAMLEVHASFWVRAGSARATADAARAMATFAEQHQGWVQSSSLQESGVSGQVTLRVPPETLGALRATLTRLGGGHGALREQVTRTDVTDALMDLDARLRVARATEARLLALLDQHGGALADVLAVERALAEQRTHIEQLESVQRGAQGRVDLATVEVWFEREVLDMRAPLGQQMTAAAREGLEAARSVGVGGVLFALRVGPALLMLLALAALGWRVAKGLRASRAK